MMGNGKLRVHAIAYDRGGCFHYRVRQPLEELRRLGHFTTWGTIADRDLVDEADVLIAQYHYTEAPVDWWVKGCETSGKLHVWEVDDDVFQSNQAFAGTGKSVYDDPAARDNIARGIAASHIVTVTTPELAEVYSKYNDNIVVLPNCIPNWLPNHTMPDDRDRYTVGYTCSPSHVADLLDFMPALHRFMRRAPGTELRFVGPTAFPQAPRTWRTRFTPWRGQVSDYLRGISMDVGIAPLADMPFNRGKSGIKAQEYQGLGIVPVVADWPQYRRVVIPGKTGMLVRSPAQWVDALMYLRDNEVRAEMASAAREHARTMTQEAWAPEWENAYRKGLESL